MQMIFFFLCSKSRNRDGTSEIRKDISFVIFRGCMYLLRKMLYGRLIGYGILITMTLRLERYASAKHDDLE